MANGGASGHSDIGLMAKGEWLMAKGKKNSGLTPGAHNKNKL